MVGADMEVIWEMPVQTFIGKWAISRAIGAVFAGLILCNSAARADRHIDGYTILLFKESAYNRMAEAKDVEGLISFYAADAMMMPPDGSLIEGRDAILSFTKESWPAGHLTDYQSGGVHIAPGGRFGYSYGFVEVTAKGADGENVVTRSSDVHIWA